MPSDRTPDDLPPWWADPQVWGTVAIMAGPFVFLAILFQIFAR